MPRSLHRASRAVILSIAVLSAAPTPAQTPVFYPPGDPARDIAAALASAAKDGKHVLLDFGADWCPDCRVLGTLFEEPAVAGVVGANFHLVRIDVGRRDRNLDIAARYHATSADWIPALVVLAADGSTIAVTDDRVRVTRRTTSTDLIALLQGWSPKRRVADLAAFTERGVRVSLHLERDRSGGLWLAGVFAPTSADTHLYATELPAEGIDGLGRPTSIVIAPGSALRATGRSVADRPIVNDVIEGLDTVLPVYPPGPVTLRLPVARGDGAADRTDVVVGYMACGPRGCLAPVQDRRVAVTTTARSHR
jgi:thiol-disulfide isomerase/thioredoxin